MESPTRTVAKAVSWQLLGLFSMALIGYFFTGSMAAAGSMAIVTAACGSICYVLHERAWNRVSWGRIDHWYGATGHGADYPERRVEAAVRDSGSGAAGAAGLV